MKNIIINPLTKRQKLILYDREARIKRLYSHSLNNFIIIYICNVIVIT